MAGMIVQHNMNALNAYNRLNTNVNGLKKSSEKLSSGYRINRAGDDAAGLAISEKMRSQIRGLNQAKRNSQDGISMIQTFEGALQETHSILQRMKELATESANGTYDNATDRAAIQLEFDQLNDELNQIADTDFNGVIVLNGGEMADGLVEVNGEFNYANKEAQLVKTAQDAATESLKTAQKNLEDAQAKFDATNYDLSESGTASEWNTVDNNLYTKDLADDLWEELEIVDDASAADTSKINKVSVTYEFDGTDWVVSKAKANDGTDLTEKAQASTLLQADNAEVTGATGNGGFTVLGGDVNAIYDATNAKAGDTVTLDFTNNDPSKLAPTNIGFAANSVNSTSDDINAATVVLKATDANMTEEAKAIFDAIQGAKLAIGYTNAGGTAPATATINNVDIKTAGTITLKDTDGNAIQFNGADLQAKVTVDGNAYTITDMDGNDLLTVTAGTIGTTPTAGNDQTWSATLAVDTAKYAEGGEPTVMAGDDTALKSSSDGGALEELTAAQEAVTAAQAKLDGISDYESARAFLAETGVSISDAYDNSTAILTYKEDITLQVGSRSKDAVNFTFDYNKADMGTLEANLNVSARKDGLNTENLKLDNQDDANHAIDQIDKAINKVSMVRATFGAMQNRLEHKIENITTTSENLTEAEASIRDTDMAAEMMNYTKYNILQQAAQSMLAQANQQPQSILQLLG